MEKTYHFMAGLPRSGSTLLAALLNQHPDVYASPQTDLVSLMYDAQQAIPNYESYRAGLSHEGFDSVVKGIPGLFYSSIRKPVIIDKNRGWGTPYNIEKIAPLINKDAKVIITMRPILEVLASMIKIIKKNEGLGNASPFLNNNLFVSHYRDKVDAEIENLMMVNGDIDAAIYSIANLLKNYKEKVIVVWFDDLMLDPQQKLNEIYEFLNLPSFKNDLKNIKEVDKHNDFQGYKLEGLHSIKNKIKHPGTNPSNYLSDFILKKYANALDLLEL